MARATITDLPTEILVTMFEEPTFPLSELYSLALLSRRLHFIALPLYLSRRGLDTSSHSVILTMSNDGRDLLAALNTALFTPHIDNLTCTLAGASAASTSILSVVPHLQRLEHLISRLDGLKTATLEGSIFHWEDPQTVGDAGLQAWVSNFEAVLNRIVNSQCGSLTILHGGYLSRTYELRNPVSRLLSGVLISPFEQVSSTKRYFRRISKHGRKYIEMKLPSAAAENSNLASLDIRSFILLIPPGLSWTLTALQNCPISTLALRLNVLHASMWPVIFSLLTSATSRLTTLKLTEAHYAKFADVLAFISRIPSLVHLTVSWRDEQVDNFLITPLPILRLPHLETLRAVPAIIKHILRRDPAGSFPKLRTISVLWVHSPWTDPEPRVIAQILSEIGSILDSTPSASLRLDLAVECLSLSSNDMTVGPLATDLQCALDRISILQINIVDIQGTGEWISFLRCVDDLCINVVKHPAVMATQLPEDALVARLRRDIKATPLLREVMINGRLYGLEYGSISQEFSGRD